MAEQPRTPGPAGASPARPRDPKVLKAQADAIEAQAALAAAERARKETEEAEARAQRAREIAEESRLAAETARAKAEEHEKAEAEQVNLAKAEREERLGAVPPVEDEPVRVEQVNPKRVTDKFWGSLGLFLVRVVFAGLIGIFGWQILTNQTFVVEKLAQIGLDSSIATVLALGGGVAFLLFSVLLLLGWATRIVSAILLLVGVFVLVFYRFGPFSPFMGFSGFVGDRDLLLTVVAFLFVTLGGGGWSIDHAIRRARAKRKADQL